MVPVLGKPLLERNIEKLKLYGVDEIILCTCYRPKCFEEYFDRISPGVRIRYVQEETPLGTGGAIKNAQRYLEGEACLIFNADIVSNIDFGKMLRFHNRKHADVTIASTYVEDPTPYGVIEFDKDSYVMAFREKPQPHEVISHYINAGVYIFEPGVFKTIPSGRAVSVEREVFPKLLENGKRIAVYKDCGYWLDLGTPEKYMQLHRDIMEGKYIVGEQAFKAKSIVGLPQAKVHPDINLIGPIYLGEGARLESGSIIGPNVVIGPNSIVGKKCIIRNSILWDNVKLEQNNYISNSIITADCFIEHKAKIIKSIYTGEACRRLAAS
jgi:mannose-1-phosphate guanylyltransferase